MKFLKRIPLYPLLITLVSVLLFIANYKTGTYLIGWDNITPEFNIKLNLERSLFGVWQGYRGLGYPDGMAQTANLMHTIYIYLLSFVFPENMLRYVYLFGTHLLGGLTMYYLAVRLFKNKLAAFVSAMYYMLNLGIIQMYYAPLEAFATHFAALPAITLTLLWALSKRTTQSLGILLLVSFLLSPQGFVPTVFFVGMILWTLIVFVNGWKTKDYRYSTYAFLVILAANAFWLLPYLYNGLQNAAIIQNSRINQFSSEEVFLRNKTRGDLVSVLTMKGFMIDAIEYDVVNNSYFLFMNVWRSLSSQVLYYAGSLMILAATIFGIFKTVTKKNLTMAPFVITFFISLIFLANRTPVLSLVTDLMRIAIPPLGEMFRFPFTKFITLFAFSFALVLGYGLSNIGKKSIHQLMACILVLIAIGGMSYPAFSGNFVSNQLRLSIPKDYQQMFDFFETKDKNARIAYLPTHTFWNWQYRDWGYRGSDFIWHGIKQPILLRPFDPWSQENEQFYNEFARSIRLKDTEKFNQLIEKYDISYLLMDESVMNTLSNKQVNYTEIKSFLNSCNCIKSTQKFGKITIYTLKNPQPAVSLIPQNKVLKTDSGFSFSYEDVLSPNYIETSQNPDVSYPFPALATDKLQEDHEFTVTQTDTKLIFTPKKISHIQASAIELPALTDSEFVIPVEINITEDGSTLNLLYPQVYINGKNVSLPAETIEIPVKMTPKTVVFNDLDKEITLKNESIKGYLINNFTNTLTFSNGISKEVVTIDTTDFSTGSYLVPVDEPIRDFRIEVTKIPDLLGIQNAVKSGSMMLSEKGSELNLFQKQSKVSVDKSFEGIEFKVKNGTGKADYYNSSLFHAASYIVLADTTYTSGLPMHFYIDNPQEDRSEMETVFSKNQKQNVVILPPTGDSFTGYGFHFTVKSVGHETAQTQLSDVSIYSIPLQTLEHIRFMSGSLISQPSQSAQPLTITGQTSTYFYSVPTPQKSGVVTLSQAYNSGWKAYAVKNHESRIMKYGARMFPFLFGTELKNHVKVNNWANGWTIDNSTLNTQHSTLVLVYLPQYLEYLGFGFLGVTILSLIIFKLLEKKR